MKWLYIFLISTSLSAAVNTPQQLANDFYLKSVNNLLEKHTEDQCYPQPDRGSCVKEFCSRLSSWECDDPTEIQNVTRACSGNVGKECLARACEQIPTFQRDDFNELSELTAACRNVYGQQCFDFFASKLPRFQLDDRQEVIGAINQCKGVSPEMMECARYTCSKMPSYQCDDFNELTNILRTCGRM